MDLLQLKGRTVVLLLIWRTSFLSVILVRIVHFVWIFFTFFKLNQELYDAQKQISERFDREIKKNNISTDEIKELLNNGDVKFSESEVHKKPCPIYKIENENSLI
jgi:hypothetical protein